MPGAAGGLGADRARRTCFGGVRLFGGRGAIYQAAGDGAAGGGGRAWWAHGQIADGGGSAEYSGRGDARAWITGLLRRLAGKLWWLRVLLSRAARFARNSRPGERR